MLKYQEICRRDAIHAFTMDGQTARVEVFLPLAGALTTLLSTDDPARMLDLCEQLRDVEIELHGFAQRLLDAREENAMEDARTGRQSDPAADVRSTYHRQQGYPTPALAGIGGRR